MDTDGARTVAHTIAPLVEQTLVHAGWVVWTLVQAAAIAIPLAILARRSTRGERILRSACDTAASVPALAVLAAAILTFDSEPSSIRWFLVVCAAPDVARGTLAGMRAIDSALLDVARALGLPAGLRIRKVVAPLAVRSWLHGLRDAATTTIATTTLAALGGAGGYGATILLGLRDGDPRATLSGVLAVTAFTLIVRASFAVLERALVPRALRDLAPQTGISPAGGRPSDRT